MTSRSVIVLEFNELSPVLMERFIADGDLPNFKALRDRSLACITDAEEEPPLLEPWVQWVTAHTGLPYAEHQADELNTGHKVTAPRIWDILSQRGRKIWVCGSMNVGYQAGLNGALLPDPWAGDEVAPYPPREFDDYFKFVSSYVRDYASGSVPLTKGDHLRFATFMATHGLSAKTVIDTLAQLASERSGPTKWKRATILDRLQWDLFRAVYRRMQPTLATFFINSTAHFQHFHWRNLDPHEFEIAPSAEDQAAHADAVRYGYRKMDEIVGEALALAGEDVAIVFCTALSQQPLKNYEADGGKQVFKPHDALALCRFAGIEETPRYAPVMSEEFHLHFSSQDAALDAAAKLTSLRLDDGQVLMDIKPQGEGVLMVKCAIIITPPAGAQIVARGRNDTPAFHSVFFAVGGLKSGYHHPDGLLWIKARGVKPAKVERKISLQEIAPSLLALVDEAPSSAFPMPAIAEMGLPTAMTLAAE